MGTFDKINFKPRYVDFGKVFLRSERGANEYSTLDRSDNEIALATKDFYLKELATFEKNRASDTLPLRSDQGTVSVALIQWKSNDFLLIQIQRRYENEFVPLGISPLTNRTFNQVRLTYLTIETIKSLLINQQIGLFSSLVDHVSSSNEFGKLKNYIEPERGKITEWSDFKYEEFSMANVNVNLLQRIINALYEAFFGISDNKNIELPKVAIVTPNMSLAEKIRLVDVIQYFIFPVTGVLTFALDYVTDRKVTVHLLNKMQNSGIVSKANYLDLNKTTTYNYFGAISNLPKDQLHHETLAYYLKRSIDPRVAVNLFRLIETDFLFNEDEEMRLIQKYGHEISHDHWVKIFNTRFSSESRFISLLRILPPRLRYDVLDSTLKKIKGSLARYAPYHLAALEGLKDFDKNYARDFRKLLREAIHNSTSMDLVQIPKNQDLQLFNELILTDFEFRNEAKTTTRKLSFAYLNEADDEIKNNKSITQVILSLLDENLFENLMAILPMNYHSQLLDEILVDIEYGLTNWSPKKILSFWAAIPNKTSMYFLNLLKLLVKTEENRIELKKCPLEFKKFLISGSDSLYYTTTLQNPGLRTRPSILNLIKDYSPEFNKDLQHSLRMICLEISIQCHTESISFAAWWLQSELAYADHITLTHDYSAILEGFQSCKALEPSKITQEATFLLSGGRFGNNLSLHNTSMHCDNDRLLNIINNNLFQCAIRTWHERKIIISNTDLSYLINKLPNDIANELLAETVLGANASQKIEIQLLPPEAALQWLQKTEKKLREPYVSEKGDELFTLLLGLKHPSTKFLRYIIIEEPSSYYTSSEWKTYQKYLVQIRKTHESLIVEDKYIFDYINLAQHFNDKAGNRALNRSFLKSMVELHDIPLNAGVDIPEKTLLVLLLYAKTEHSKLIQQRVDSLLTRYVTGKDFRLKISSLQNKTFQALHLYVLTKNLGEHSKSIGDLFGEEASRRQ